MAGVDKLSVGLERLSAMSSMHYNAEHDLSYTSDSTPAKRDSSNVENGALREWKPLALLSVECIGLLAQYAGVGFLTGIIPGVIYPVLQGYLNAEGTTVVSATVLVQIPWC